MTDALSTIAASRYLGLQPCTLRRMRRENRGPAFIRISGNRCVYDADDLQAFRNSLREVPKQKAAGHEQK